jgi:hypothetical protein
MHGPWFQAESRRKGYNMTEATPIQETTMNLPVKFPSQTEVILDDVARFRAKSPEKQFRSL